MIVDYAYWWALALGACFGGNLTLVAAAANVAAAGMAERSGRPIGFVTFLKVGEPVTIVSMRSQPPTSPCATCEPAMSRFVVHPMTPRSSRSTLDE